MGLQSGKNSAKNCVDMRSHGFIVSLSVRGRNLSVDYLFIRHVDARLLQEHAAQRGKWREIVKRLLHCTRFLAQQNIPFRGHREQLGTSASENPGNFLALLDFLSEYDSLIREHLDRTRNNPKKVSFLSNKMQNEFIELIGNSTRQSLVKAIKGNKYFRIIFD